MRFLPIFPAALLLACLNPEAVASSRPEAPNLAPWFEPARTGEVFHSRFLAGSVTIDSRGAWLQVWGDEEHALVRLRLLGAKPLALEGEAPLAGKSHYQTGRERKSWRRNVPHFARIRARQAYPGVDVLYYANDRMLEYDFVLAPGSDPARIAFRLEGGPPPEFTPEGHLRLVVAGREVLQHRPFAYQVRNGVREPVDCRYASGDQGEIRFELGAYDPSAELVIDPVFSFNGYFGGTTAEVITGVASAPDGTYWITGAAQSELEVPEGEEVYQPALRGLSDAFMAQIEPVEGNAYRIRHFTYLGGSDADEALAVAVNRNGVACITGWTLSFNYPLAGNAFQTSRVDGGDRDAFVSCYDTRQGGEFNLVYSSYYGLARRDEGRAIAVSDQGVVVIGGSTFSGELKQISGRTNYQPSNRGGVDGFIAIFDPSRPSAAETLIMNTFYGGDGSDTIDGLALLPGGLVAVAGGTSSTDLPLEGASFQTARRGLGDGYVAIFDPARDGFDQLLYATYLGGDGLDRITALGADSEGKLWVTGLTQSADFPVTPTAYSTLPSGGVDAFVARLDPAAGAAGFLLYSTVFGGSRTEVPYALAVVSPQRAAIAGYTNSHDYPSTGVIGAPTPGPARLTEMFAAAFDASVPGTGSLLWSLQFGGAKTDVATGIAVGPGGQVLVVGYTDSYGLNGIGEDIPGKRNGPGLPTGFFFALDPEARP